MIYSLDLLDLLGKEAEEADEKVVLYILARFQDAPSLSNGKYIDANGRHEVVKVGQFSSFVVFVLYAKLRLKYIYGTLKVELKLDTTSEPKPIAEPYNLLLMLV